MRLCTLNWTIFRHFMPFWVILYHFSAYWDQLEVFPSQNTFISTKCLFLQSIVHIILLRLSTGFGAISTKTSSGEFRIGSWMLENKFPYNFIWCLFWGFCQELLYISSVNDAYLFRFQRWFKIRSLANKTFNECHNCLPWS